jgi:endonuclease/exonuclease/phosphatase family metal-dependent hydrolase
MRRLIALLVLPAIIHLRADPLRVSTWNLNFSPQAPTSAMDIMRLSNIAAVLSPLNPDVILLQEVPDRQTCERLAALLGSSRYQVATCSAFTDESGHNFSQVAILTKDPVVAAWTEPWEQEGWITPPGGLACAAIRHGAGLVIIYSIELKDNATGNNLDRDTQINILNRELSTAQLLRHLGSIDATRTNPSAPVIIGGSLNTNPDEPQFVSENTLRLLAEAGFTSAFADTALKSRITRRGAGRYADSTCDYILGRNATFSGNPNILASALSGHLPVTGDLRVGPAPVVAESPPIGQWPLEQRQWTVLLLAALLLLLIGWWWSVSRKRFYSPAQAADSRVGGLLSFPDETTDVFGGPASLVESGPAKFPSEPPAGDLTHARIQSLERRATDAEERARRATELVRKGLVPQLGWLMRNQLFRGVVTQRAHLLEIQRAGAEQVAELEQRLMRIQCQLQSRLTAYERRIAELEKEVSSKDQLNRELLASRMELVKQALEAARARQEEILRS